VEAFFFFSKTVRKISVFKNIPMRVDGISGPQEFSLPEGGRKTRLRDEVGDEVVSFESESKKFVSVAFLLTIGCADRLAGITAFSGDIQCCLTFKINIYTYFTTL